MAGPRTLIQRRYRAARPRVAVTARSELMDTTSRVENLEIKCAYLEQAVQELSDMLVRTRRELEQTASRHQQLGHQLDQLAQRLEAGSPDTELPPHY